MRTSAFGLAVAGLIVLAIAAVLLPVGLIVVVTRSVMRLLRKNQPSEETGYLSPEQIRTETPLAIAIHGTFAPRARWALEGSEFQGDLVKELSDRGAPVPLWHAFQWSGRNTVSDRADAISRLDEDLNAVFALHPDRVVTLIAHSHGGNIAFKAAENHQRHPNLRIATLATPFLTAQPRLGNEVVVLLLLGINATMPALVCSLLATQLGLETWLTLAIVSVVLSIGIAASMRMHRRLPAARDNLLRSTLDPDTNLWLRDRALIVSRIGDEADGGLKVASLVNSWVMKTMRETDLLAALVAASGGANVLLRRLFPNQPQLLFGNARADSNVMAIFTASNSARVLDVVALWLGLFLLVLLQTAVGASSGLVAASLSVASSETPPGEWRHFQSTWSPAEEAAFLSHSQIYDDPKVLGVLAQWMAEQHGSRRTIPSEYSDH